MSLVDISVCKDADISPLNPLTELIAFAKLAAIPAALPVLLNCTWFKPFLVPFQFSSYPTNSKVIPFEDSNCTLYCCPIVVVEPPPKT